MLALILVPVILFAVGFVVLIVYAIRSNLRIAKEKKTYLSANQFEPFDDRTRVAELMCQVNGPKHRPHKNDVRDPMRALIGGEEYFHLYYDTSASNEDSKEEETFLFPLERRTDEPVILYLSSKKISKRFEGFMSKMLALFTGGGLEAIKLPRELEGGKIVAAIGPKGMTIYDLIESGMLATTISGADVGVQTFRARGKLATVSLLSNADLKKAWPFVRQLAR